jgi:molecular chaperone GrpE
MTDAHPGAGSADEGSERAERPVIRDRRRIDPQTGKVRDILGGGSGFAQPAADGALGDGMAGRPAADGSAAGPTAQAEPESPAGEAVSAGAVSPAEPADADLAAERLADLQRVQAEYVNYRKRVERDRDVARDLAVSSVLEALLPAMDDVQLARQHGDLEGGPFAAVADKLEVALGRFGLTRFGEPGEPFDPAVHEALMRTEAELADGTEVTTVVQVLQPGYRVGDRLLRAARVAVADPQ